MSTGCGHLTGAPVGLLFGSDTIDFAAELEQIFGAPAAPGKPKKKKKRLCSDCKKPLGECECEREEK